MPQVPDPKELLFAGLHQGIQAGVAQGLASLTAQWGKSSAPENALDLYRQEMEKHLEVYLAACDVVNAMTIPTTAKEKAPWPREPYHGD